MPYVSLLCTICRWLGRFDLSQIFAVAFCFNQFLAWHCLLDTTWHGVNDIDRVYFVPFQFCSQSSLSSIIYTPISMITADWIVDETIWLNLWCCLIAQSVRMTIDDSARPCPIICDLTDDGVFGMKRTSNVSPIILINHKLIYHFEVLFISHTR